MRPNQERLQDAAQPDRLGKLLERGRIDAAARLVGVRLQQIERHVADGRSLRRRLDSGIAQQRGKAAAEPRARVAPGVHGWARSRRSTSPARRT